MNKTRPMVLIVAALALAALLPVGAEGFRDIATVSLTNYDGGSWRLEAENVFLARVVPALTLQAKLAREDSGGSGDHVFSHTVGFGPVISFTDTLYLITAYNLEVDSDRVFDHEIEADFNYETEEVSTSLGVRWIYFPASEYFYFLPSISFRLRPGERLGLFAKLFISGDSDRAATGSLWGEADYAASRRVTLRAGFTGSYAEDTLGWSLLAGTNVRLGEQVVLKYGFSWFTDTVEYAGEPSLQRGVRNALTLDAKF